MMNAFESHVPFNFVCVFAAEVSGNVAIGLPSHPHLHQLISSSQLFSTSDAKSFLGIALRGATSNGFDMFICLIISSLISEESLASEKDFEQCFFHITAY